MVQNIYGSVMQERELLQWVHDGIRRLRCGLCRWRKIRCLVQLPVMGLGEIRRLIVHGGISVLGWTSIQPTRTDVCAGTATRKGLTFSSSPARVGGRLKRPAGVS